jgi:hypothetical protein
MIKNNEDVLISLVLPPQPPQGGASKYQQIRKSPLGDLGVDHKKGAFETAPISSIGPAEVQVSQ